MSTHTLTPEEKLRVVELVIQTMRPDGRKDPNLLALKEVAADLRARCDLPRNNTLGSLARALELVKQSKTALGYDQGRLINVANIVVNKWATISQALEQFGEESAE